MAILIAEDDPNDVVLLARALRKAGLAIDIPVVRDGEEALLYLQSAQSAPGPGEHGLPELIILDLKMPRLDGLEVLRRIKDESKWKAIPVLMLTGAAELPLVKQAYELGAATFLIKPVQSDDDLLLTIIAGFISQDRRAPVPEIGLAYCAPPERDLAGQNSI